MIARAFAKVNLALEVGARRGDGFHELLTLFQTIAIHDRLALAEDDELRLEVVGGAPAGADNLVWRAAEALAREAGIKPRVRIRLEKGIPAGGGLGGGSSDAALTLVALDRLWRTDAGGDGLYRLALALGSDVPFFLLGGTAVGFGRGEKLLPVVEPAEAHVVLVLPGFPVPTASAYAAFDESRTTVAEVPPSSWRFPRLWQWQPGACEGLGNGLEPGVFRLWPELGRIKDRLVHLGAEHALLSGSGSTVFGLFRQPDTAETARAAIAADGLEARVTTTLGRARWERLRFGESGEGSLSP